jgi:hypothetical protein
MHGESFLSSPDASGITHRAGRIPGPDPPPVRIGSDGCAWQRRRRGLGSPGPNGARNASDDLADVCRELAVSEQTFYRWRNQFGAPRGSADGSHGMASYPEAKDQPDHLRFHGAVSTTLCGGVGRCRAGEWASRDEAAVAQSEPHAAARTSDWNLQSGLSEEMTRICQCDPISVTLALIGLGNRACEKYH